MTLKSSFYLNCGSGSALVWLPGSGSSLKPMRIHNDAFWTVGKIWSQQDTKTILLKNQSLCTKALNRICVGRVIRILIESGSQIGSKDLNSESDPDPGKPKNPNTVSAKQDPKNQCCGSGSRIRCLFDPWIRDPE